MEVVSVFRCPECGFDNTTMDNAALVEVIANQARKFRAPLTRGLPGEDLQAVLRLRPSPDVWSALEYVNHYRDAVDWYGQRIELVLTQDRPQLEGRDFTLAPELSDEIMDEIDAATNRVAERLRSLTPEQWSRVGIGSSDGGERDIRNLASRLAHEGVHHLLDIGRRLRAARS